MAKRKPVRVVVDTNAFISFLIGKRLRALFDAIVQGNVQLVVSQQLIRELEMTAMDPKFRKYFTSEVLSELLFAIEASALAVEIQPPYPAICRDPKDDFLLALCKKGKVDFLVTGDKDLLAMLKQGPTEVITPREFGERLK